MFASLAILAGLAATAASVPPPASVAPLVEQCAGKTGWDDPAPPVRLFGKSYYVGTCGISAVLIASPRGHLLIDGGTTQGAALIRANIERLGFRIRDVRLIVSSHEHFDHVGGLADLKAASGARLAALPAAARVLARGRSGPDDPQSGVLPPFSPVGVERQVQDGETIRLGPIRLTAHATPGHAPGGASWSWRSCEGRTCRTLVYADSVSAISDKKYRFTDNPAYVTEFRRSMARIAALRCDILLTPHPGASQLFERLAGSAPLADAGACRRYAGTGIANLDRRLKAEAMGTAP